MVSLERPTIRRIAAQLDVHPSIVQRDMKAIRGEWREARTAAYDEFVDMQFGKLASLEEDARRAIQLSFNESTEVTDEFEVVGQGDAQRMALAGQRRKTSPPQPNTSAMAVALKCIQERNRMLGIHDGDRSSDDRNTAFVFTTQIDQSVHLSMGNQEEVIRRALADERWNGREVVLVGPDGKKRLPADVLSGGNGGDPNASKE